MLAPGPPGRPVAQMDGQGSVALSWAPPLSRGVPFRILSYVVQGRRGGECGQFEVVASIDVGGEGGEARTSAVLGQKELGRRSGGWWEFSIIAANASAHGPQSAPSLPLLVLLSARGSEGLGAEGLGAEGLENGRAYGTTTAYRPPAPIGNPPPVFDLGGVLGAAFATIGRLFWSTGMRRGSFMGGNTEEAEAAGRSVFAISSDHESTCELELPYPGADPAHILEELLAVAADTPNFPLRARSRQLYEWPVRGERFKHGKHCVEMRLASLFALVHSSMRAQHDKHEAADASEGALPERLQHLELLTCIVMHARRGEREGRLVLEAEPTHLLTALPVRPPLNHAADALLGSTDYIGATVGGPAAGRGFGGTGFGGSAGGASSGGLGGFRGSFNGVGSAGLGGRYSPAVSGSEPIVPPRGRMLKRAATVPSKLDQAVGQAASNESEGGLAEIALRSLELTRMKLSLEVSRGDGPDGKYTLRCGLSAGMNIELPTPWFVPRVAIEAAGGLLLNFGLKIGCEQMLKEVEWLGRRGHKRLAASAGGSPQTESLGSRSPSPPDVM